MINIISYLESIFFFICQVSIVSQHREVAEDSALYWTKEIGNLVKLIEKAEKLTELEIKTLSEKSTRRIEDFYNWEYICGKYKFLYKEEL